MTGFFVDYAYGDNLNGGTSTSAPWKHCPGDPLATGNAAACVLVAGDVVNFKGGVTYRGQVECNRSGSAGSPITYQTAPAWGTGAAVIDGADIWTPVWTQCMSAAEAQGNANWANMWWATAPVGFDLFTPLYEDGEFLWFSEDPNVTDPLFYDRFQDFREIPVGSSEQVITRTTIKDSYYFTQADSHYWDDAYALVWHVPDTVTPLPVTAFDPATHTITFPQTPDVLYTDRSSYFAMVGPAGLVDIPGEFGLYDGKIFIWPRNSDAPADHTYSISARKKGFYDSGVSYVSIEDFKIVGFHGLIGDYSEGVGVHAINSASHLSITNNEFTRLRSMEKKGAVYAETCSYVDIENNSIHDCQKNQGVLLYNSDRVVVADNSISRVGYHGVMSLGITNSRLSGNLIQDLRGTHAVGISVYDDGENVLVANNRIIMGASNPPCCVQRSKNIYVIGNVFDGMEESKVYQDYGTMTGTNYVLHNTFVRAYVNAGFEVDTSPQTTTFINNIIDGGSATYRSYNLYVGLYWNQTSQYGWSVGTGEVVNTSVASIFTDYANGDFTLKSGSPAIGAGTDVSAYYPTALFPDFDFTKDLTGATRSGNDLGAYEYATGGGVEEEPSGDSVLVLATSGGYLALGVTV